MLLIDVGNTSLKWALLDGNEFTQKGAACYQLAEIDALLGKFFSTIPVPSKIYISCVAGVKVKEKIDRWLQKSWQINAEYVVSQKQQLGLMNAYTDVGSLGVDRWCGMLGAWFKFGSAFCVIDCGTAVTLDVVDANGQHLGGLIMPGLGMMHSALKQGTDAIDHASGQLSILSKNTADAVGSGCNYLLVSGLESLLNKYRDMLGKDLLCIVTGGDGRKIAGQFSGDCLYEADLVLQGLKEVATSGLQ